MVGTLFWTCCGRRNHEPTAAVVTYTGPALASIDGGGGDLQALPLTEELLSS